jgi:hypothetical protein
MTIDDATAELAVALDTKTLVLVCASMRSFNSNPPRRFGCLNCRRSSALVA